ncbi:hypothetical protein [Streptomyces hydrogenans]|uniref:hypothetical protein n=1 Tax=Streptomyces hydrogenans TaxID=1873719 RepID=UPI0033BAE144
MPDAERNGAGISVLIEQPYGGVECALAQWINTGPGARCAHVSAGWPRRLGDLADDAHRSGHAPEH